MASVVAGWGVAQWPYLIVPDLTAAEAAAPKSSLGPIAIGLAVGAALVAALAAAAVPRVQGVANPGAERPCGRSDVS